MVQEAVKNGGGDSAVVIEDGGPLFEGFVGGQHDGAPLVSLADDLEEKVGSVLVDGQIADLVHDEDGRMRRFAPIIPLMDYLDPGVRRDAEVMPPLRPRAADVDLAALRAQVRERTDLVGPRLLESAPISSALRWLIWRAAILLGLRRKVVDGIMAKIEREIAVLG